MNVIKRDGSVVEFDINRIIKALTAAFDACQYDVDDETVADIAAEVQVWDNITVEEIQDQVEELLFDWDFGDVAREYITYRANHAEARFTRERLDYMDKYSHSLDNAATSSETDANANVTVKNVANLDGEVYKNKNRDIQRQRMKDTLNIMFPEVAKSYIKDLEHHIIYTHDEATVPTAKQYCMAVSLYPLMMEGVGAIDGVTPSEPNDLLSFSGQLTNLAFLLSSQCKGAVAFGEYFVALNYYIIAEFGEDWYNHLDEVVTTSSCKLTRTVKDQIHKAFKQFVYGINQPAGNRGFQSPFTNISYYDHTYFDALFKEFCYPDGTKPKWEAIDVLQRMFMKWFNKERSKVLLTFPVETLAMVHDNHDIIDKDYKELCAEMYSEGHSFFTYISDSADSLASCCRLKNELQENTFNPTSGLTGVMTGSCNVITLNINRIVQDAFKTIPNYQDHLDLENKCNWPSEWNEKFYYETLIPYIISILERVYKYHIAYKTILYDMEKAGMFSSSNGGYIYISKLYSTIGINGLNEAARFLGLKVSNNPEYKRFLQIILSTIKEQNKLHSIHDNKRPFLFNSEVVPAEGLGGKNYRWDKEDGYWVPEDENLYNSYFYNAHDDTSILDKFILHGKETYQYTDGGSAAHINLDQHPDKEQMIKLINFAIEVGTSYFTLNVPYSKCESCGHIVKAPIKECPKCHSTNITWYTRIIGYLRPIKAFAVDRQIEAAKRVFSSTKQLFK